MGRVCRYWLQGRCSRNPCRFMHTESPNQPRNNVWVRADPEQKSSVQKRQIAEPEPEKSRDRTALTAEPEKMSRDRTTEPEKMSRDPTAEELRNEAEEIRNAVRSRRMKRNAAWIRRMKRKVSVLDQPSEPEKMSRDGTAEDLRNEAEEIRNAVRSRRMKRNAAWIRRMNRKVSVLDQPSVQDQVSNSNSNRVSPSPALRITMLAKLQGHTKAITGIALPSDFDKLYSVAKDGTISAWDCNSGQCAGSVTSHAEVGCLMAEGPWVCAGFPNCVKAYNVRNGGEFGLAVPGGLVCSMVEGDAKLFAGMEDGTILVWNWNKEKIPEPAGMMKGHNGAVCSLVVGGANRLYSASRDSTIKVWDRQNLHCLQTLHGHTRDVLSVLCWDSYLISASLDNTLKVWCATESGKIEVTYEIKEDCGMIALCGIHDAEMQPILLCSCGDNTVRLYDLPSFKERGRIFSKHQVEVISIGSSGLFFTGDASGEASVWKLHS